MAPQCQTPSASAKAAGTVALGRQTGGSVGSLRSSSSSRAAPKAITGTPAVALTSPTTPVRRVRSTKQIAWKPGIEPLWPTRVPAPPRNTWKPSACA